MRIIKKSTIRGYWESHPDAKAFLQTWLLTAMAADWTSLLEVRGSYPHADGVKVRSGNTVTVFNVAGNKYRLIVSIKYKYGIIYVREFLTHSAYSKDSWKERH